MSLIDLSNDSSPQKSRVVSNQASGSCISYDALPG